MVQPALFSEPEPFPRLPGPAVGPKGPKIGQKPGARFIILPPKGLPAVASGHPDFAKAAMFGAGDRDFWSGRCPISKAPTRHIKELHMKEWHIPRGP